MKDGGKNPDKTSSISASILSLGLTIVGFSDLKLEFWWHYPIAISIIMTIYAACYCIVELVQFLVNRFKRASIIADVNSEFSNVLKSIDSLQYKVNLYGTITNTEYKKILEVEIKSLYRDVSRKISFIRKYYDSPIIKNKGNLPNIEHLHYAEEYCSSLNNTIPFLKD